MGKAVINSFKFLLYLANDAWQISSDLGCRDLRQEVLQPMNSKFAFVCTHASRPWCIGEEVSFLSPSRLRDQLRRPGCY